MDPTSHEPDRLFVDVDTGIDDAFALLYACAEAHVRLAGISTVVGNASLPEPEEPAHAVHAVDALIAGTRAHAGRLILAATGPLTNVALAVMREPELPRLVKRFVIMGGAYADRGNVTPSAEFNIWHDPEAARIVFRAFGGPGGAPVVAVGLDVTRKVT